MNSSKKKINGDNTTTSHKKTSKLTNKGDLNPSIKSVNDRDIKIKDEIDEIFSKARNKVIIPTTSSTSLTEVLTSSTVIDSSTKEKEKSLNDKEFEFKVPAIPDKSKKRKLQENDLKIIPSSLSASSATNTPSTEEFVFKVPAIPDKSKNKKLRENDTDGFSDSRGTKSHGFVIYDIKELNLGNGGGMISI
ncbi:15448_t:CDS:2 [Racocetra fulgida]|uniref:15448_t:CDS:1 n=1 Tax=Racocetra fulgida TaxID=60492 RepID=A0A9N9D2N2_9GLOM|nr:15448_t:CDS:2 [Racocetra fulgida]